MNIALYGGAFDPPHNGHALVAAALLNSKLVEQVWFVPTGDRYDKKQVLPASLRLKMLRLFVKDEFDEGVEARDDDMRVAKTGGSTLALMRYFRESYPHYTFSFVIGSDLLVDLPSWRYVDELKREVSFLVVEREGYPLTLPEGFNVTSVASSVISNIASSSVRRIYREGGVTAGMVSPSVRSFIRKEALYRG